MILLLVLHLFRLHSHSLPLSLVVVMSGRGPGTAVRHWSGTGLCCEPECGCESAPVVVVVVGRG
jgi:hypothetical protein